MSLLFNRSQSWPNPTQMVAERTSARSGGRRVDRKRALQQSVTWACLRLRADLISTMPVDVFRKINGVQFEVPKPPVFVKPGGGRMLWNEWMYATQFDLDSCGNTFGIIRARDGLGLPAVIELVEAGTVTVASKNGVVTYKIGGKEYTEFEIWHERQFVVAGFPLGLSPIAHAAMSLLGYLSAQEFANDWFTNSAVPSGHLKNTARTLKRRESLRAKASFKAAVQSGDVWVSGQDWEYKVFNASASEASFIATLNASEKAACRFLGVPADMVDVDTATGSVTYANVTQRNLQLLIVNIGPAVVRREAAFTEGLLPVERYAKLNPAALLRMDLKGRYDSYKVGIDGEWLLIDEVRKLEDMPPIEIPVEQKVQKASDALGALVRAGFDPSSAAQALGLPEIKHTGLVPITVTIPEPSTKSQDPDR